MTKTLEKLASLLCWEGRLNNSRVRDLFNINSVRASQIIRDFRTEFPRWLNLDTKTRSYHATKDFYNNPDFKKLDLDLQQYLAMTGGTPIFSPVQADVPIISNGIPDISGPRPEIFSIMFEAIRRNLMVNITYQSLANPQPQERKISPHNIVKAGRRWHVRAYCNKHKDFRDYVLGRVLEANVLNEPCEKQMAEDERWMTQVPVRLIAHPSLSIEQMRVIQNECFNMMSSKVDSCRGALVGYYVQHIQAAVDIKNQCPPDYQIAVENISEIKQWLFPN